jgi:uncharacterized RmlC-like cupin family protein
MEDPEATGPDRETGCRVIHAGERYEGKQGISFLGGVSAESASARAICMHLLTIPPDGRGKAHLHQNHETAIYLLEGRAACFCGEGLRERVTAGPGDFVYIPAGEPHLPVNLSSTEPVKAVVARTDPNEQESVVLLPELDDLPHTR